MRVKVQTANFYLLLCLSFFHSLFSLCAWKLYLRCLYLGYKVKSLSKDERLNVGNSYYLQNNNLKNSRHYGPNYGNFYRETINISDFHPLSSTSVYFFLSLYSFIIYLSIYLWKCQELIVIF